MRKMLLVSHTGRTEALEAACEITRLLTESGIEVGVLESEAAELLPYLNKYSVFRAPSLNPANQSELVIVLGGDGTILRAAELVLAGNVPLLGVNLGHVGFLAESERDAIAGTVDRIIHRTYRVEARMTLTVNIFIKNIKVYDGWALNEISVEKSNRKKVLQVAIEVDNRPLSTFGCDGVVVATPTGSTAYAFSAGGPVIWPNVEALLMVPISAHSLFARPLVVGPESKVAVELMGGSENTGVLWCDGRRGTELPPGARVEVIRSSAKVHLARLNADAFTDRLVAKFQLPVAGWRGQNHSNK